MNVEWKLTISFARFNAKHEVTFLSKSSAKEVARKVIKEGIWVIDSREKETYWGPEAIAKMTLEAIDE